MSDMNPPLKEQITELADYQPGLVGENGYWFDDDALDRLAEIAENYANTRVIEELQNLRDDFGLSICHKHSTADQHMVHWAKVRDEMDGTIASLTADTGEGKR